MTTTIYLNGKKIPKKNAVALVGEQRMNRMLNESKESFFEDPNVQNDYYIGGGKTLTIRFH